MQSITFNSAPREAGNVTFTAGTGITITTGITGIIGDIGITGITATGITATGIVTITGVVTTTGTPTITDANHIAVDGHSRLSRRRQRRAVAVMPGRVQICVAEIPAGGPSGGGV